MCAYSASKAAIIGFTKTCAKDLAPHGIRVNAISPQFVGDCEMWDRQCELQASAGSQYFSTDKDAVSQQMIKGCPMRRCGTLQEVVSLAVFLMSYDSSYISAANIKVTGGIP